MRRDCPKRQGSWNYRATQSQSLVEQARTLFIFSHLSAGQRDQYQSQSAVQAPSATQIGQRGQGMGRSRGQDFWSVLQGPRGMSTVWYRRLSLQISLIYRVRFGSHTSLEDCCLNSGPSYSCLLMHNVRKVWA